MMTLPPKPHLGAIKACGVSVQIIAPSNSNIAAISTTNLPLGMPSTEEQLNYHLYEQDLRVCDVLWWSIYAAEQDGLIELSLKPFHHSKYNSIVGIALLNKDQVRSILAIERIRGNVVNDLAQDIEVALSQICLPAAVIEMPIKAATPTQFNPVAAECDHSKVDMAAACPALEVMPPINWLAAEDSPVKQDNPMGAPAPSLAAFDLTLYYEKIASVDYDSKLDLILA